jgi:Holliday junction resolvasome RuvABC endonuclease subunit
MKISIGIDPSLTGTAVCALDSGTQEIMRVLTVKIPAGLVGVSRLSFIVNRVNKVIKAIDILHPHARKVCFIEGYAFAVHRSCSVFNLGELGGIIRLMLAKRWGGYYDVPPTVLKKFITGKGNSKKQIMLEQTFRRFGIGSDTLTDDNQVDAFGLAKFGSAFIQDKAGKAKLTKYECEAVKSVKDKCTLSKV